MASRNINVLLTTFHGLGLPPTYNLRCPNTLSTQGLQQRILETLPPIDARVIITTISNKEIMPSDEPLVTLLSCEDDCFVQLRLSVALCGGKGGFGSQLRAAGGRMSSKRKKNQGENNSSNRNLDGRRLRTVNEAKALAEYLALKPDMEKMEKHARKKRWEQVVDLVEKREEEFRTSAKGKVDGKWVEDKEEAGERTREAVFAVMERGDYHDNLVLSSLGEITGMAGQSSENSVAVDKGMSLSATSKPVIIPARTYMGFDDDDEYMSDTGDEESQHEGKGKGKA